MKYRANKLNGKEWLKNSRLLHARPRLYSGCFAGSGSTLTTCMNKPYKALGIDTNGEYKKIFEKQNLKKNHIYYIIGDSRNKKSYKHFEYYDICITSPPYWDILNMKRTS